MEDNLVCLGVVVSPHGIRGAVKIKTFTEKPENISIYGDLVSDCGKIYKVNSLSVAGNNLVIAIIDGISSRNEAEPLRNKELYVEKNKLPELNREDEFYQDDLIGMEVRLEDGKLYGYIRAIHNFCSDDILEILVSCTKKSIMLAFSKETFPCVNLEEGYITLRIPEFIERVKT